MTLKANLLSPALVTPNIGVATGTTLTLTGNMGVGQATFGTSATRVIALGNGTAPSTSPPDAVQIWSGDNNTVAGQATLLMRNEPYGGTQTIVGAVYKTDTGDPATAYEGMQCINTSDNTVRMYSNSKWRQLYPALPAFSLVAGVDLLAQKAVAINTIGKAVYADNTLSQASLVLGITTEAVSAEASVNIQTGGRMYNAAWSLTPGDLVYVGTGGAVTATKPTSGYLKKLGIATATNTIMIELGTSITLV